MEKLIQEKLNELQALSPENREYKTWLNESNLWNWLYSDFIIQGRPISKAAVLDMFGGVIRDNIPLSDYAFVQNSKDLYSDMHSELSMSSDPSLKLFKRWMKMLFGDISFRETNPVVYEYGLIPCHFKSIEEELEKIFKEYTQKKRCVEAASVLFLDILRIYPYREESTDAAMAVLLYCLEGMGLPIPEVSAGKDDFENLVKLYMDKGNFRPFCDMLTRCICNRLDAVLMVARQAKENDEN